MSDSVGSTSGDPAGTISDRAVGRLVLYRRRLQALAEEPVEYVFSHELARCAGVTAAQVRRDMMTIGYLGNPARGYQVVALIDALTKFLETPASQGAVLVGIGNLGRALLAYFGDGRTPTAIRAAFDVDPAKLVGVPGSARCYPMSQFRRVVKRMHPELGILAVPGEQAPDVAREMCAVGISGILNFAPVRLEVPETMHLETIDLSVSMERAAYLARRLKACLSSSVAADDTLSPDQC